MDKPVCIDLFCGKGGWTDAFLERGFRVIGFDIHRFKSYRGELVLMDVRNITGWRLGNPTVIVASPPCQGFSEARYGNREDAPGWQHPDATDLELVLHTCRVIREANPRFWVIENVRGAIGWFMPILGRPSFRNHPWYLWGTFPGFLLPRKDLRRKSIFRSAALRARIPGELAYPLADAIWNELNIPDALPPNAWSERPPRKDGTTPRQRDASGAPGD